MKCKTEQPSVPAYAGRAAVIITFVPSLQVIKLMFSAIFKNKYTFTNYVNNWILGTILYNIHASKYFQVKLVHNRLIICILYT